MNMQAWIDIHVSQSINMTISDYEHEKNIGSKNLTP